MQKIISRIIAGAVIAQLLSIIFRQSVTIGGEILIPALVLLIRQAAVKIMNIFTRIKKNQEIRRKTE